MEWSQGVRKSLPWQNPAAALEWHQDTGGTGQSDAQFSPEGPALSTKDCFQLAAIMYVKHLVYRGHSK